MCDHLADESNAPWSRLARRVVFESDWFKVWRDEVLRPDGSRGDYDHVMAPGSVTVLAMDESGRVIVTRQWIYVHAATQWRLPGGRIDETDADVESAARRELVEETGIIARRWEKIGVVHGADAFTNHRDHAFLATDLHQGRSCLESGEADLRIHWLPFGQVVTMVAAGEMPHAGSAFAVLMAHAGHVDTPG